MRFSINRKRSKGYLASCSISTLLYCGTLFDFQRGPVEEQTSEGTLQSPVCVVPPSDLRAATLLRPNEYFEMVMITQVEEAGKFQGCEIFSGDKDQQTQANRRIFEAILHEFKAISRNFDRTGRAAVASISRGLPG